MTIFKKLPLMAFGLGLGFITVMGMSSFTNEKAITEEPFVFHEGAWVRLSSLETENTVHCTFAPNVLCKAIFDTTSGDPEPSDIPTITEGQEFGLLIVVPIEP